MTDILSTNDAIFPALGVGETAPAPGAFIEHRSRPNTDPIFPVEMLMEGRGAHESVFEDATPFLQR